MLLYIGIDVRGKVLTFLQLLFSEIDNLAGDTYYTTSNNCLMEWDGTEKMGIRYLNTDNTLNKGKVLYKNKSFLNNMISDDNRFRPESEIGETIEK